MKTLHLIVLLVVVVVAISSFADAQGRQDGRGEEKGRRREGRRGNRRRNNDQIDVASSEEEIVIAHEGEKHEHHSHESHEHGHHRHHSHGHSHGHSHESHDAGHDSHGHSHEGHDADHDSHEDHHASQEADHKNHGHSHESHDSHGHSHDADHDSHEDHHESHDADHKSHGHSHEGHDADHDSHEDHHASHDADHKNHGHSHESHDSHDSHDSHEHGHHDGSHHHHSNEDKHDNEDHWHGDHIDHHHDHKIYTFQVGDNFGAYEYLDSDGHIAGFYKDLVTKICNESDHECEVVVDNPQNCWHSDMKKNIEKPGVGLMGGYYDGCMGYSQTSDRANSFKFSKPFTTKHTAALYARQDLAADKCDPMNLNGLKIGLVDGWSMNRRCISRKFNIIGNSIGNEAYEPVIFKEHQDMMKALIMKEINAVFTIPLYAPDNMNLTPLCDFTFECTQGGISLMTRKDSSVTEWWDAAYTRLVKKGEILEMCEKFNEDAERDGIRGKVEC